MSFNQKKYINDYNKQNYKLFSFRIKKNESKIIDKLKLVSNLNKYIVTLIQNDIGSNILTIKEIKQKILPILNKYGINEVYLFGSYARGDATEKSDVDIYCSSGDIKTLIQQDVLEDELKQSLKKEVDIIFIGSRMNDYFKKQLEGDKIRIC